MPSELEMAVRAVAELGTKALAAGLISWASLSMWDLLGSWLGKR